MGWLWAMIVAIVIGAIVGFIAGKITKTDLSLFWTIVTGIVGGFIGSWILPIFGLNPSSGFSEWIWQWVCSIIGAVILLLIVNALRGKKRAGV